MSDFPQGKFMCDENDVRRHLKKAWNYDISDEELKEIDDITKFCMSYNKQQKFVKQHYDKNN